MREFKTFKSEMDIWVKQFNSQMNGMKHMSRLTSENTENIDHNYELIQEMRAEMKRLKEEVQALRMVQLLHLKSDIEHVKSIK